VLAQLWNFLNGFERLKHRGDRWFLAGEFDSARRQYLRARSVVSDADHRASALDWLIASCERQSSSASGISFVESPDDLIPPGLEGLFELAIADKSAPRIEAYRILGEEFRAGYVALIQGMSERAVLLLERAAASAPNSFVAHLELGRALSLAGRLERAGEMLAVASRLAPEDDEGRLLAAAVDVELGRFHDARGRLLPLARRGEAGPEVLFLMGKALAGIGKVDDALETFRETVKMEPHFHEAFFEAARLLRARGDVTASFQLLQRATSLAPDEVGYNRELASLVLANALDEEAGLAACDRLMVTDDEDRWQYLHWIAELYIRRGWKREARDPLRKALELVPPDRGRERHAIQELLSSILDA
jgi:tetratricopeptide (TPR) repeat protein